MQPSIIEIKKARRKKDMEAGRHEARAEYKRNQAQVRQLLKEIRDGLDTHQRATNENERALWGYVGDLKRITAELSDLRDRLNGTGEYARG